MLYTIRCARGCVVTTPESRIDFDNLVLWALDPFLFALARDSFLRTLGRENTQAFLYAQVKVELPQGAIQILAKTYYYTCMKPKLENSARKIPISRL